MHKYSRLFFASLAFLCMLGFVLVGTASVFPKYTTLSALLNTIGGLILIADIILVLVADWKGFVTLNGRINWSSMSANKRFWLGLLFWIFSPVMLVVYLIQIARYKPAASPDVPPEIKQYMLDGDLRKFEQTITESLKQHQEARKQSEQSSNV
jgi:hypothetical protein